MHQRQEASEFARFGALWQYLRFDCSVSELEMAMNASLQCSTAYGHYLCLRICSVVLQRLSTFASKWNHANISEFKCVRETLVHALSECIGSRYHETAAKRLWARYVGSWWLFGYRSLSTFMIEYWWKNIQRWSLRESIYLKLWHYSLFLVWKKLLQRWFFYWALFRSLLRYGHRVKSLSTDGLRQWQSLLLW